MLEHTDALVGQHVGNYVITRLLGRGGMGEVYLGEHPKIGRKVAIKILSRDLLTTAELAARFLAEAKTIARIGHPNVIQVFDFGTIDDGRLYFMMELLEGRDLQKVLQARGKLTAPEVVPLLQQICAGLQAAHDCGVVHRDMKPENVFVIEGPPLQLKVLDFGIAKVLETGTHSGRTATGIVMGTPLFIAPEQALGQPERITPRTDLYSVGVMLYLMLAGSTPFRSDIMAVLLTQHIQEPPPPLRSLEPSVPGEVAAVVERCLEKDPLQRFESAAQLAQAFADAVCGANAARGATELAPKPSVVDTTAPPAPAAGNAERQRQTTMSASAGELAGSSPVVEPQGALRPRLFGRWLGLAAGTAAIVAATAIAISRQGSAPPGSPARAIAASASAPRAVADARGAASPPTQRRRFAVLIRTNRPASCRVTIDRHALGTLDSPCRFDVEQGKRVHVEVVRPGAKPQIEEWIVEADRTIDLVMRTLPVRAASARVGSKAAARAPAPKPPAAEPKAEPQQSPETPAKRTRWGEGTMGMD